MKKLQWFSVVPLVLILFVFVRVVWALSGVNDTSVADPALMQWELNFGIGEQFLYLLANAFIAYTVYAYQEQRALIYIHVVYCLLVLWTFDAMVNGSEDVAIYALSELLTWGLDIMALVYAARIQNPPLAHQFKIFTAAVLIDKVLGLVASYFLDGTLSFWIAHSSNVAVMITLFLLFWKLPQIPLNWEKSDRNPEDLLDRRDLE